MRQEIASVTANVELMPQAHLVWLESPQIASIAQPGQFVMVRCGGDTVLRRPLSIHQQEDTILALLFTVVGRGTQWLSLCQPNDKLDLVGPLGNGFTISPNSKKLLLVAGGIGIAPIRFLADEAVKLGLSVTLLCGTPTSHRYPPERLPPEIELVTVTEDGTVGRKGMITDLLPDFASNADQVFACGPLPMYKAMAKMSELRNKPVQISLEVRMGCGLGICYGCTVKTKSGLKQVCKDGPIFEMEDIIWEEMVDI